MMALFQGGETLHANATGDPMGAPQFNLSLTAPSRITVSMPVFPGLGMTLMINRAQPLNVAWTNGTAGKVQISTSSVFMSRSVTAVCTFPASMGSGVIPSSVLSKHQAMGSGSISIVCTDSTFTSQGEWSLGLTATNTAVTTTGAQAFAQAQFQ
jgi:hypothetical protein